MPSPPASILVIDENRIRATIIEAGLRDAGHHQVTVVHDIVGSARLIVELDPDVIVIDLQNPNRDMLEHMLALSRSAARPIVMFVDQTDQAATEAAMDAGVSAYIVDDLRRERVKPILDIAISRFNAFSRLTEELDRTRRELDERKQVDRAKAILMKSRGLGESEAYALLRKTAMNQGRRIAQVAESLITAAGLLDAGESSE
ncbi:MAG: ANTAR domain-containing protein [Burkholderiaceae bacterium]|nr:ANTAR domain-containing protein [Burkholderiaceae bacterium]